jgi:hypothetical protein
MKDAMTKLKQQAAELAARAAAEAEEASKFRAQAEAEYNDVAAQLEEERKQVRCCDESARMHAVVCAAGWPSTLLLMLRYQLANPVAPPMLAAVLSRSRLR